MSDTPLRDEVLEVGFEEVAFRLLEEVMRYAADPRDSRPGLFRDIAQLIDDREAAHSGAAVGVAR